MQVTQDDFSQLSVYSSKSVIQNTEKGLIPACLWQVVPFHDIIILENPSKFMQLGKLKANQPWKFPSPEAYGIITGQDKKLSPSTNHDKTHNDTTTKFTDSWKSNRIWCSSSKNIRTINPM